MKYKWGAILGVWGSAAESDVTHLNRCNKMRSQDVDSESSLFGRHSAESHSVRLSRDDQRSSAWWISSIWAGTVRGPQSNLKASRVSSSASEDYTGDQQPLTVPLLRRASLRIRLCGRGHRGPPWGAPRRYLRSVKQWNVTIPHN